MKCIKIWDYNIEIDLISNNDYEYLKNFENKPIFSLKEMWIEMDRIWDLLKLNNKIPFKIQNIGDYYSHPVWILNGLFSMKDQESNTHRLLIASYIKNLDKNKYICDFGGGFGELSIIISQQNPKSKITILEPFMSKIGLSRVNIYENINIKSNFETNYDVIIAQDVLEHVENPVKLARTLINYLNKDGYLIFANCFHPFIKAHLPANFHLSRTFKWIMKSSGLSYIQNIPGAPHIEVYKRDKKQNKFLIYIKVFISIIFQKLKNR
jgi:2-polyprenyl-3-methyl-5-hydroxy-6-metoxy-1,4-benzoquinol methylase